MKHSFCAVALLILSARCLAAPADKLLLTKEPESWKEVAAGGPGGDQAGFPTRKFVPADGRNAALMITLVGTLNGRVPDLPVLKRLHTAACQRFLSSPDQQFAIKELQLPNGAGYYSTFEDPDLVGKPPVKDNFKFTSPCFILFKTGEVVNATFFADEKEGKSLPEAVAILQTLEVQAAPPAGPLPVAPQAAGPGGNKLERVTTSTADVIVGLPQEGLKKLPHPAIDSEAYFFYGRKDGLMVSGWLEPSSAYAGFQKMWAADKQKMEQGTKTKLEEEKLANINGWEAVSYVIKLPGNSVQAHLRACRVSGHTWIDLHLSLIGPEANHGLLREYLEKVVLLPKQE